MRSRENQGADLVNYRSYAITRELSGSFNAAGSWRCDEIQFSSANLKSVKDMIDLRIRRRIHRRF